VKKAQTASPQSYISLLIFVIGLALIIYILMLPPGDRQDLLGQNVTKKPGEKSTVTVLMTKDPGTLRNIEETEIIHTIPDVTLFSRTDSSVLVNLNTVYVKKSLFEEQARNVSFKIDRDNVKNPVLSFRVPRHTGILTIILNGNILTSEEYTTVSPQPIDLPEDWLTKENTLVFKVSGPGIEFWKSNEYLIQDMKITADITDTSGRESKQVIVVEDQEKANTKEIELTFVADCTATEVSPLEILLNTRQIYKAIPDCGMRVKVPPGDSSWIRQGQNSLLFKAEKGLYNLYSIEMKVNLEKAIYPTYYFQLSPEAYDKVKNNEADVNVSILFTNSVEKKLGTIFINDYFTEIDTYESSYTRKINSFVRQGNNAVEIRPKSDKLDILQLEILLAE